MGKLDESVRLAEIGSDGNVPLNPRRRTSWQDRVLAMDGLREILEDLKQRNLAQGNFLGMLNVLIGRRVSRTDGTAVSPGATWRLLAEELKRVRWNKEDAYQLPIDPKSLAPRDRERFWYQVIASAQVDSPTARQAGDAFAEVLRKAGYTVGPGPK